MQRVGLFFFLTLGMPLGIYWASHGFEGPGRNVRRFLGEVKALEGEATGPDLSAQEPEREPGPEPKARAGAPTPPKPEPAAAPEPEPEPIERAQKLFEQGKFEQAALTFVQIDEQRRALALLGAAFAKAFPAHLPETPYLIVRTNTGASFEGFAAEGGGLLKLTSPGGRELSLPTDVLTSRTELARAQAVERLGGRIAAEGADLSLTGTRLFALLQEAFLIGRPDLAASLLGRMLALDERKPFFLSSVHRRVPAGHQDELYRAFGRCQILPEHDAGPTVARAPRRLGDGQLPKKRPRSRSSITDKKALELVRAAAPHRERGRKLHRKVFLAGLKKASGRDIDEAIRELETAIESYEKAAEIEDNNEIHALLRYCSKLAFQLRFWKEQVDGR